MSPVHPCHERKVGLFSEGAVAGKLEFGSGPMDVRPRIEEQRGLEQSMGNEVKNRKGECSKTALHDHIAHLSHGGIDERALNAGLCQHRRSPD